MEDIEPFCGIIDTPVLEFPKGFKAGRLPYQHAMDSSDLTSDCDIWQPPEGQYSRPIFFSHLHFQQVCIPVGCVPTACCPYLPACTAWGVSAPGGGLPLGVC